MNHTIFSTTFNESEDVNIALEANMIRHTMKEQYTLRDKYYPYVESMLPKTEHLLLRFIMKYEDKHADILNSPYPTEILPFGLNEKGPEYDIIYRSTGINPEELRADIKKVPLPGNLTKEKAAFLPSSVTLYLIIRYYYITKQFDKAEIIYSYYGYSIYWKRFHKSFPFTMYKSVMIWTVNEMSYRNLLKRLGSVKALITYIVKNRCEYYVDGIAESCDEDIRYILDQIQSDMGSKLNSIAGAYYKNYNDPKKREIMMGNTMLDNEGTRREDTSRITTVESHAQKATNAFFSNGISINTVKTAVSMATEASVKEVEHTLANIYNNATVQDIHDFYSAIFFYYLSLDDPKATEESIKSMKFLALMRPVIKKGNTNDKNVKTIIEFVNKWLEQGSNTFRITSRDGTKSNYRKAVYFYFLLLITSK